MAHIDNLIAAVADTRLRAALQAEHAKAIGRRQFGLVFDTHQPESVVLPQLPIRVGDKVRPLLEDGGDPTATDRTGVWYINRWHRGSRQATLINDQGQRRELPLSQMVAVREFGDPLYPGLRSNGRIANGPVDKPWHTVINAENHHALEALLYPYEGKVDAIYIDPPYNTGARDWRYNNDYVDSADPYAHSKWLSFMDRRLRLAKRLLDPDSSTIVVTIDEKEIHRLGMLLDQVFPGARRQLVTIVINPNGVARKSELTRVEEYALFVFLGSAGPCLTDDDFLGALSDVPVTDEPVRWERLIKGSNSARREDRPNLFYPVYVDRTRGVIANVGEPIPLGASRHDVPQKPGLVPVWPIGRNGDEKRWQVSAETLRKHVGAGTAKAGAYDRKNDRWSILYLNRGQLDRIERSEIRVVGRDEAGVLQLETAVRHRRAAKTVWNRPSHKAGDYGSGIVKKLTGGRVFPYPKSLYAVEDTLRVMVGDKPEALVLDFFAGSGTTTHAVSRLNRQDGGRRRTITVTNNEVAAEEAAGLRARGIYPGNSEWEARGIYSFITVPRITAAITGRTPHGDPVPGNYTFVNPSPISDGLAENVEFFELTYEDVGLISLGRRFGAIAPLLWLKAGAVGPRIEEIETERGWAVPQDATYGVLFDAQRWPGFVDEVNRRQNEDRPLAHVFVVTDSINEFQQVVSRLDGSQAVTRLYADYLRTFEINTAPLDG